MKKPEILATAGSMDELRRVIDAGADAVTIGESRWGVRLPGDFLLNDIAEACQYAKQRQAKIYVTVNKLFDNNEVTQLAEYLKQLAEIGADAIVFGDPSVIVICRQEGIAIPLHWNAEMTSTNYAAANYWGTKGATRVVLARELNMEQVLDFKRNTHLEVQVQVHGATNIYHSRRKLIRSYMDFRGQDKEESFGMDRGLYLVEGERPDLRIPVYEDENGTHIMSAEDICMLEELPELIEGGIDSFKIEGLQKTVEYNEAVVRAYRSAVDAYAASPKQYEMNPEWLTSIQKLQDPHRELTFGFFFKEQVY